MMLFGITLHCSPQNKEGTTWNKPTIRWGQSDDWQHLAARFSQSKFRWDLVTLSSQLLSQLQPQPQERLHGEINLVRDTRKLDGCSVASKKVNFCVFIFVAQITKLCWLPWSKSHGFADFSSETAFEDFFQCSRDNSHGYLESGSPSMQSSRCQSGLTINGQETYSP